MVLKVAARGRIDPFIVMEVMRAAAERAATGADVVHLEVGQPSTPAPRKVLAAAKAALDKELIGYTLALGIPELRARIARHYREFYGADVPAERIVVTTGSSGGFLLAFLTAFEPGDRVALASPGYPCYRNILTALGIEPVIVPMEADTKYQPTVAALEQAQREMGEHLDGLIVASPSNPVGAIVPEAEMRALMQYCRQHGIRFISDEIYHGITYGVDAVTAAAIDDQAIVVNSFSKYFSMTGWRLGWLVVPPDLVQPIERVAQNLFISPPTLSQHAGIAAFDAHEECRANVRRYAANRELLLNDLPSAGFDKLIATDGAFYVYADVSHLTGDSLSFCSKLLSDTGVAIAPGIDFDTVRGGSYVRLSFAGPTSDIEEAVRRIGAWLS